MRILQIIDSLEAGGAERMAINYANALADAIEFSGLVVTRKEGALLNQVKKEVSYLYLNKKGTIDIKAVSALRKFVVKNKVEIIHAHSTSFFLAFLLKLSCPSIKLIWHEHYGARVNESRVDNLILFFTSFFFTSVFVVNHQLEDWVKKKLFVKKVFYIPNFAASDENQPKVTVMKGEIGRRIVCLANLKKPKNHIALLFAFEELKLKDLGWSLHLIGKDYNDEYSNNIKEFVSEKNLKKAVFIYDSQNDIQNILSQATIGILCSTNEGFPVSLLEYGLAKLAVVSTNVGYCSEIIKDDINGLLFNPLNNGQVKKQLYKMVLVDKVQREVFALHLHNLVLENYSKEKSVQLLLSKYNLL
ncbi:Glycosyltransferase involved in cell wall bisynthesis [Flavobacterium fluvii]|uniref:Glycosyltransferase involved in cell wall bisynthesis n=1 Tax=Flavobacterium fluvii TaxID=468056 RepID=A0A1M5PDI7_9FLAO|nr:glycosyltransferase [Flavobacterium fluvii]SHG99835.1 Glycosyltransferase involved in cell wall bisynthesis [Flavobacterium fluvii]